MITGNVARTLVDGVVLKDFSEWTSYEGNACLPLEDGFILRFDSDTREFRIFREGNVRCSIGDCGMDPVICGRSVIFGSFSSGVRIRVTEMDTEEYISSRAECRMECEGISKPRGHAWEVHTDDAPEERQEAIRLASLLLAGDRKVLENGYEMHPARGLRFSFGSDAEHGVAYPADCYGTYESPDGGVEVWVCGYAHSDGELIGVEVDDELLTFGCSAAVMDIVDGTYPPEIHDTAAYADSAETTDFRRMLGDRSEEIRDRMLALSSERYGGWT